MGGPQEGPGRGSRGYERFELMFSSVWGGNGRSELTFSYVFALGRFRSTLVLPKRPEASKVGPPPGGILGGFGPRAGTFKEGTRTFIADTVYLLLDT